MVLEGVDMVVKGQRAGEAGLGRRLGSVVLVNLVSGRPAFILEKTLLLPTSHV
jgi:hypothetical protein